MNISWNEIRRRAAAFAKEWAGEGYEKGQTQLFYRDLFEVFGMPVRRVAAFEEPVKKLGDARGYIDLFWKGVLLVEQKSRGMNLEKAKTQALEYFPGLKDEELPRYLLISDFETFTLFDLDEAEECTFRLEDLPREVEKLGFIVGVQKRSRSEQDPVSIHAAELVHQLYAALEDVGYSGDDLERLLVRLVFCFFSDDTGVFEHRDMFLDFLERRSSVDGADLGARLEQLFQVLNTPVSERQGNLDEDLARFPYINGGLFNDRLKIPSFDYELREVVLQACRFDWSAVSPAIFGSLFQSILLERAVRPGDQFYTTAENILRVIEPLFLAELKRELDALRNRRDERRLEDLRALRERLGRTTFFDPACGSGNFLVVAYQEIRLLEIEIIKEIKKFFPAASCELGSVVTVAQFFGIEIERFAVRVAEAALWMTDHLLNTRITLEFGVTCSRIPLTISPGIRHGDALTTDWNDVLDSANCDYVLGNPPYKGAKKQSKEQRQQVRAIAQLGGSGGTLDYVCAWFIKAAEYLGTGRGEIAFVATNSISQGAQVGQLWPVIFERFGLEIRFAHQTFKWGSNGKGNPQVHVVIVGLRHSSRIDSTRQLYSFQEATGETTVTVCSAISPYLLDGSRMADPHMSVRAASKPINGMPRLVTGSKPIDGGAYTFDEEERRDFVNEEPGAAELFRPFIGGNQFLYGDQRFILHLQNHSPKLIKQLPFVKDRIARVREYRQSSPSPQTQKLAETPLRYHLNVIPVKEFLVIPEATSENREYVPIAWLSPPIIPSNLVKVLLNASLVHFAILTSAMHMSWLRIIGGRLENRYRYSISLVYNTFPLPEVDEASWLRLLQPAQRVLDARASFQGATLADLYDTDAMPDELRSAHAALDAVVDRLYRLSPFTGDEDRVGHLLERYERMVS